MPDLPDGLTEEDLEQGKVMIVDPPEQIDVEPGEVVPAEVTGSEIRSHDAGDEKYWYYELSLQIEDAFEVNESFSMNNGNIHQGTQLGHIIDRFDDLEDFKGDDATTLDDIFVDEDVHFYVDEDEQGFTTVAVDEDGISTLFPADQDIDVEPVLGGPEGSSGSADDEEGSDESESSGDAEDEALAIIAEHDGEDEQEVKKALAKESGSYIQAFNDLVSDGTVSVDDDGVVSL